MRPFLLCCALLLRVCWALPPVPGIEGHFTSRGSQVTSEQKKKMDELLGKIQEESRVDLAILIMDQELGTGTLSDMANQTFHAWSIGKGWDGGGALIVVSKDCQQVALAQSSGDLPFREKHFNLVKESILNGQRQGNLAEGMRLGIERARRVFRSGGKTYLSAPPQQRDVSRSIRYSIGALAVFLVAVASSRLVAR